jgi:hypothetical protein
MLKAYGNIYFSVGDALATERGHLAIWQERHRGERHIPQSHELHSRVLAALREAESACAHVSLGTLSREIDRTIKEYQPGLIMDRCGVALRNISERFQDELEDRTFLYVSAELAAFYDQDPLSGERVFEKFKDAREDIKNAGNCYAVGQSTACVFHLMRGMEVVVRKLARRPHMNITITPRTTWRQITGAMDARIKAMPDSTVRQKQKREDWESARANLYHVGSVWRNGTMHPAMSYTQSQARDVLDACRVFMNALCVL